MKHPARVLILCIPLALAACATMGPPQPPSLELPKPPSDLRAVRKGDRVTLTWTIPNITTDRQRVNSLGHTRICRTLERELTQCGAPVGEVVAKSNPGIAGKKATASYVDSLPEHTPNPSAFATYAVEALNQDGRGAGLSNRARVSLAGTLPPPRDFSAQVTGQGVVLRWTEDPPAADSARYLYRIYRSAEDGSQRTLAGELRLGSERNLILTDVNIEWGRAYEYRAEIVTVIAQEGKSDLQIEGDDTAPVKVFAHDVFPPAVPAGLQAVYSGPGQQAFIDLIWAPVTDVDLDGYNIYRHAEGGAPAKLNAELVKTPAYRDVSAPPGKKYFYSVSAVDVRGNESAHSEEASETVP